jgi:hypothetical protein
MYTSKFLLLLFIFLLVWFGLVTIYRAMRKDSTAAGNFILIAISVAGIVAYFL